MKQNSEVEHCNGAAPLRGGKAEIGGGNADQSKAATINIQVMQRLCNGEGTQSKGDEKHRMAMAKR